MTSISALSPMRWPVESGKFVPLVGLAALMLLMLAMAERTIFGSPGAYDVSAAKSEISPKSDTVVLTGAVEVTQNDRRFRSPHVVITYSSQPGARTGGRPAARSIRHLEADGPAYFVTPDRTVRADHASYDAASGDILFTGGVIVTQGRNVSTGDRLVVNEGAGTVVLSALPGKRVRSVLYPQ